MRRSGEEFGGALAQLAPAEKPPRRNRRAVLALLAAGVVLAAIAAFLLWRTAGGGRKIEFEDFLVERCVREALGKEWDEAITAREAASLTELTVNWEGDMTVGVDKRSWMTYNGYVNLADLRYLTGLESLTLDFPCDGYASYLPMFENLDAIASCKNLRSLTMPSPLGGYSYGSGYIGKGYRWMADIFGQLPNLEEVDFWLSMLTASGPKTVPEWLQELLDPDGDITFTWKNYTEFESPAPYYCLEFMTEEITEDMEDAIIQLKGGETFDCESLKACKQLKTLAIAGDKLMCTDQVLHLEALKELPHLAVLSLYGVEADLDGIEEFPALRELYLTGRAITGVSSLQQCSSLQELYVYPAEEDMAAPLSEALKNLPELRYLYVHGYAWGKRDVKKLLKGLEKAEKLQTLVLGIDSDAAAALEEMPEGPALKNLFLLSNSRNATVNLESFGFNDSLESFCCDFSTHGLTEFIDAHPNLVSVLVQSDESWQVADYNDAIDAATESENMSFLMFPRLGQLLSSMQGSEEEWQSIKNSVDFEKLYKSGIYDSFQETAFGMDRDIEEYYEHILRQ